MERGWLEHQLALGSSLERMGELADKHPSTVAYWLRRHGLRAVHSQRYAPKGGISESDLRALVEAGLSIVGIAGELGLSAGTVQYWLKAHGLKTKRGQRIAANQRARVDGQPALNLVCGRHGRARFRRDATGRYRCVLCSSQAVARRRRRVKEILVRDAGGRCALCGYDRYLGALHFHHLERAEKSFAVSRDGNTRALATIRAEVRKCLLLCSNCHAEVEGGVMTVPCETTANAVETTEEG